MKIVLAIILVVAICQVQAATKLVDGIEVGADRRSTVAIFSYDEVAGNVVDQFCSGVLIHPEWVLTSATCVKLAEQYNMRVTTANLIPMTHAIFDDALMIKNQIAHPNFVATTLLNDIGLIQLEDHMDKGARTLKLPQVAMDIINTFAIVRGYGNSKTPADNFKQKERTDVFITDNTKCVASDINMMNKICTLQLVACKGDEGGPLISQDTNTIVGITSLSEKHLKYCALSTPILSFTPYTNVWLYKAWIRQVTGLNL